MPTSLSWHHHYNTPPATAHHVIPAYTPRRRASQHYPSYSGPILEITCVVPAERESDHDYCRRKDSTYADLHRDLVRQREHKESIRRRLDYLDHRFGSTERRETRALYEDLKEEIRRLERRVEERKWVVLRR